MGWLFWFGLGSTMFLGGLSVGFVWRFVSMSLLMR